MVRRILDLPFLVILMGITCLVMVLPVMHALVMRDHWVARPFFYGGTILFVLTTMIAIATSNYQPRNVARSHLAALLGAYLVLPLMMALPMHQAMGQMAFLDCWFEMLSAFTLTGGTLIDDPATVPATIHLWRALVGWLGGFFVLLSAVTILMPMNLGGFEVLSGQVPSARVQATAQITRIADPSERLVHFTLRLFPTYTALTLTLWVCLLIAGENGLVALSHAMGTLSTSGISPVGGLQGANAGILGEFFMLLFLIFAISRRTLPAAPLRQRDSGRFGDPEIRMALVIIGTVVVLMILLHWTAVAEHAVQPGLAGFFRAIWGTLFTATSFLTTTGYTSVDWTTSQTWSGIGAPGMVLLGLAIFGGGVATTAGGVKLLRVYALFRHGENELARVLHPSAVVGAGQAGRHMARDGVYVAWIFFMLFGLSIGVIMAGLCLLNVPFEDALVVTIACLTNTGPAVTYAAEVPIAFSAFGSPEKMLMGLAMVLGRMEALAFLALFAPDAWKQ